MLVATTYNHLASYPQYDEYTNDLKEKFKDKYKEDDLISYTDILNEVGLYGVLNAIPPALVGKNILLEFHVDCAERLLPFVEQGMKSRHMSGTHIPRIVIDAARDFLKGDLKEDYLQLITKNMHTVSKWFYNRYKESGSDEDNRLYNAAYAMYSYSNVWNYAWDLGTASYLKSFEDPKAAEEELFKLLSLKLTNQV